jgi:two-component system CheB/CheR fusion protein
MFPLLDRAIKHIGFTKVMRNLDERKLAEEQLHKAKDYAEAIVSNSRHPILVLTHDLTIYAANDAFYRLFGLKNTAKTGGGFFKAPEIAELVAQVRQSGQPVTDFELRMNGHRSGKSIS